MDEKNKDKWPEFYPSDMELPPNSSTDADGVFYRLVQVIPPSEECFFSTHQVQPNRHKSCKSQEEREAVYGTSFWSNKENLLDALVFLPQALKQRKLASGQLNSSMGKMRKTLEEGHYTVWLRQNCNIHSIFSEVK